MRIGIVVAMTTGERWKLALRVTWLVDLLMARWMVHLRHREDVRQECILWLYEKSPMWEPSKGAWSTYAKWIISSAIRQWRSGQREYGPKTHRTEPAQRSGLNCVMPVDRTTSTTSELLVLPRIEAAVGALTERQRVALVRRCSGEDFSEIAIDLGCSRQRVGQLEQEAICAVRRALARENLTAHAC